MLLNWRPSTYVMGGGQLSIWGHLIWGHHFASGNTCETYISNMPWRISTRLGHKNSSPMTLTLFDHSGVEVHVRVTGVKNEKKPLKNEKQTNKQTKTLNATPTYNRVMITWFIYIYQLGPLYKSSHFKNSSGVICGHRAQNFIFTQMEPWLLSQFLFWLTLYFKVRFRASIRNALDLTLFENHSKNMPLRQFFSWHLSVNKLKGKYRGKLPSLRNLYANANDTITLYIFYSNTNFLYRHRNRDHGRLW